MSTELDFAAEGAPDLLETIRSGDAASWLEMIRQAETYFMDWQRHADNIDQQYADLERLAMGSADREFQIFWANLEVLKPTIYSRAPQPVVMPRYRRRDPVARRAAEILERAVEVDMERDHVHETLEAVRDDLLLPGRGAVWLRYHADNGVQEVDAEHVSRRDFLHSPARSWRNVTWVARRGWLRRDQLMARFPGAADKIVASDQSADPGREDRRGTYHGPKKYGVWEIWYKPQQICVWVSEGCEDVLDVALPPVRLDGFYPCPQPAYTTVERHTLRPVPDMVYYRDQLDEINEYTSRIAHLSQALRVKGFYPGGSGDVGEAIELALSDLDNRATLIPVSSYAALGGASLRDAIVWLPLQEIAQTIQQLVLLRRQVIEDLYQVTGLSDIMRGSTNASETLGAQQLKAQYGSVRARERQEEMIRVGADVIRMKAEIMAERFEPQTLLIMSQVNDLPTDAAIAQQANALQVRAQQMAMDPNIARQVQANPQMMAQAKAQLAQQLEDLQAQPTVEKVMALLRAENVRPFSLDVESDSTIQPDEQAEKQRRTEFLTSIGGFLGQALPLVQQMPQAAGLVSASLKFAAGGFRAGRQMDDAIDEFADMVEKMPKERPPDPRQQEAELKAAAQKAEHELDVAKFRVDTAARAKGLEIDEGRLALDARRQEAEEMRASWEGPGAAAEGAEPNEGGAAADVTAIVAAMERALNRPRRIVFDDKGRPAGIEPADGGDE